MHGIIGLVKFVEKNVMNINEYKGQIQCHHIVPYRITQDNSIGNLITLCRSCHIKEEWKYYRQLKGQSEFSFW